MPNPMLDTRIAEVQSLKDQVHLDKVRERNEALRLRFLNPRLRMVGRDVDALKLQMKEREEAKQRARDEDIAYGKHVEDMDIMLRAYELEEKERKLNEQRLNKAAWDEHATHNAEKRAKEAAEDRQAALDFVPGVAAAQMFDGEDPGFEKRKAIQAAQIRKWTRQQIEEREQNKHAERKEDVEYAQHVRNMVEFTDKVEQERRLAKVARQWEYRDENKRVADEIRKLKMDERRADLERERRELEEGRGGRITFDEGTESRTRADDPTRFLEDGFKGYNSEMLRQFYEEQRRQRLGKEQQKQQDKEEQDAWARQQETALQHASQISYQHKLERKKLESDCMLVQKQQMEERKRRQEEQKRFDREAAFSDSFFERFGNSHR